MTTLSHPAWLPLLEASGVDPSALAAGDLVAWAQAEGLIQRWADLARERGGEDAEPRDAWTGTQAAQLSALAASLAKEAA